ncbi:hypothetical protein HMPREF3069_28325 [Achromobacter xylosoxidans]|uniref:hypothetical protein n=1 Tax=Alcaligenes xylosoxydans xylosoxydans TaxID=85698 RepID=UPI0008A14C31|nr:hypothetical protein [Achromobacter xylosoxidans]OFS32844.1 hypothetical protein HMPREF3069_28325 [Achromobacter xylosoxidans]
MDTRTVFQTDNDGLFLYETEAHELPLSPGTFNIPFGAVDTPPPRVQPGQVARHTGKKWEQVEDHRAAMLQVVATEERYIIGQAVEIGGRRLTYAGWGPLPDWLSTAPARA